MLCIYTHTQTLYNRKTQHQRKRLRENLRNHQKPCPNWLVSLLHAMASLNITRSLSYLYIYCGCCCCGSCYLYMSDCLFSSPSLPLSLTLFRIFALLFFNFPRGDSTYLRTYIPKRSDAVRYCYINACKACKNTTKSDQNEYKGGKNTTLTYNEKKEKEKQNDDRYKMGNKVKDRECYIHRTLYSVFLLCKS